ncbi:MAG: hypothetical protein RR007_07475, partial [Kiritimatiellia bacterium]
SIEANKTIKTRTLIVAISVAISVVILSIVLCVHFRDGSMMAEQAHNEAVCEKNAEDAVKKLERDAVKEKKKTDAALKKEKEKSEKLEKTLEKVNADLAAEKAKNTVPQNAGKDNASTKKSQ